MKLHLVRHGPALDIWSSDLRRARATAERIGQRWAVVPALDARLREMNFGEWDGRFWNVLEREDPDRLKHWMESWVTERVPGGAPPLAPPLDGPPPSSEGVGLLSVLAVIAVGLFAVAAWRAARLYRLRGGNVLE